MRNTIVDDLEALLCTLPDHIQQPLRARTDLSELLEVVLDLGRPPEARFPGTDLDLDSTEITEEDIQYVVNRIGKFGDDNRAGIERTLHRFSAMRNRRGKVVGITCRVGRAVYGTIRFTEDLIATGKSMLLLGRPGVGKTTLLREVARVLADDNHKRVVVVDTSNEIAGDGDIPHPGIGRARRMQVPTPPLQHAVMIEAVENHMPEVIIIDEMGTELEAAAARTIAERGVQLIATAHGNTLENLLMNPTLSDLVGGVQTVTLGDDEARRRRTQKTVLERKRPPTFDVVVEIKDWERVAIHADVAPVVDAILRGILPTPEVRWTDDRGQIRKSQETSTPVPAAPTAFTENERPIPREAVRLYPFGINRGAIQQALRSARVRVHVVDSLQDADILLTTKAHFRRNPQVLRSAEERNTPVYGLRKNSQPQVDQFIRGLGQSDGTHASLETALQEAQDAVERVSDGEPYVELNPQRSYARRHQHLLASRYNLQSRSIGQDPERRVTFFRSPSRR
ncbi:MAG: R3H domain-containing nucleic acid-binding protein [Dehalococcoidia bacterium]